MCPQSTTDYKQITSNHCCANETFTCSSTQFGKSPTIAHVNIGRHVQWRRSRTNRPILLAKCQVRSSPESVSAEHHSPRSACAVSVDMDDQHVIDVVDKSECTDDDLVLLARIQQTTPPPTHRQRKGVNNNRQMSASTQARRNTYAESVTRGRRQPNKHGRSASLTTTQTDSAMIRGNGTSSNIRSANPKRRSSTSKARKQVGVFITHSQDRLTPKTWRHTSSERLAYLCHSNL